MMHGLCDNSLTTIATVCRRAVERSGAPAISTRKSFTCNLLTSSKVSTEQQHYRAAAAVGLDDGLVVVPPGRPRI
jgi:hypothetical protein